MNSPLAAEQLEALAQFDTPTICNAIEQLHARGPVEGFLSMDIRCLFPELGPVVGYALTATVDTTTPDVPRDRDMFAAWSEWMERAPKPGVLVFKDVGPRPRLSAHFGEGMARLSTRLGMVGLVTDGGVRDLEQVRALGFHYFARGAVASHGNNRILELGVPVEIDGVRVVNEMLIHADSNGVTTIPSEVAEQVADTAAKITRTEEDLFRYIAGDEFTAQGYRMRVFGRPTSGKPQRL